MPTLTRYATLLAVTIASLGSLATLSQAQQAPPTEQTLLKPGTDRWPVKTATDDDAPEVVAKPVRTTVEALLAMPRPADMPLQEATPKYQSHRARGVETTVFTLDATVVECRLSMDGDYHVTIQGKSGTTMVLEIPNPDPKFVSPGGRFARQLGEARKQFDAQFRLTVPMQTVPVNRRARITGIGYFGHSSRAVEGNLIQLHPLLKVQWLKEAPVRHDRLRHAPPMVRSGQTGTPPSLPVFTALPYLQPGTPSSKLVEGQEAIYGL